MDESSPSSERSFIMLPIEKPRHSPYFNSLSDDTTIPREREPKRRSAPGGTPRIVSGRATGSGARQRAKLREQPRRRQYHRRQLQDPNSDDELREPQLFEGIMKLCWPVMMFVWQVFIGTLDFVTPWIPIILGIWIVAGLVYFSINFAFLSASNALSPLCNIPIVAWYWSGYCGPRLAAPSAPKEFEEFVHLQSTFEDVLSSSASDAITSLPMDITRSALILGDLRHSVNVSALPSKNELVLELAGFHESANEASRKLGSFGTSIGRAVDKIIATNTWTLRKLDSIVTSNAERGLIGNLKDNIMSPFKPRLRRYDEVLEQYLKNADIVEEQITSLILEAQALVKVLELLDGRLDQIAFITRRDGVEIAGAKDELLASLWTFFGGNRYEIKQSDRKLALLQNLTRYNYLAVAHVMATIRKLEGVQDGLKDLRQRIAEPGVEAGKSEMPLEWHIFNIQLGLERLVQQKLESNRVQGEALNRYDDSRGGRRDESMMIEGNTGKVNAHPRDERN